MVKIRQNLVDVSKYDIKCPYEIKPEGITIHNTANKASAANEISYMRRNNNEVSFHYAVDDIEIVQGILDSRNAWHAGDKKGPGNMTTIAIEICYSTGDKEKFEKAQLNAAEFVAYKMKEYGWEIDKIYPHKHWSGKHCPHRTLDEYGWDYFIDLVKSFLMPKVEEIYRIRKDWKNAASQVGAYKNLDSAIALCDKYGVGYFVFDSKGNVVHQPKVVEKDGFEVGDAVSVKENGVWTSGKTISPWVFATKMYVRKITGNNIQISSNQVGAITGTIDKKYLVPYGANTVTFKSYLVRITASTLNVRAGAGTSFKINTTVRKGGVYTIVEEKNGWGKLKSGAGWISLSYTEKL